MKKSTPHERKMIVPKSLTLAVSAALAMQAQAQEAADDVLMEQVIVTATKRAESLQDIPIAVTAISGETLVDLQINNVLDIEKTVPGMKVRYSGADPSIIIRGAGSAGTTDTAVPMYIDGLYRPRAGQALASYLDLERVEVLRGPQGTLFGRNTFGGLVNLVTNKPDMEALEYGGAITYGEYDLLKFEGFLNVPLGDTAAFRLTATNTNADPYIENTFNPDGGMRDEDNTYVRGQFKWAPNDDFDMTLTGTYWTDNSNGNADYAGVIIGVPVNSDGLTDGINGVLQPRQGRLPGQESVSRAPAGGRSQAGTWGQDPAADINPDVYKIASDFQPLRDIEETSVSALVNWKFGPVGLRANLGWFDYEEFRLTDSDFSQNPTLWGERNPTLSGPKIGPGYWQQCYSGPTCGLAAGQRVNSTSYQADINLYSDYESALEWTLGFFYYDDSGNGDTSGEFVWGYTDYTAPQNVSWAHWLYQGNGGTKSTAVYGQATYSFNSDRTRLTGGLRYSKDDRKFFNRYIDYGPAIHGWAPGYYSAHLADSGSRFAPWPQFLNSTTMATQNSRQDGSDSHTDWKISLQHDLNANVMLYANAATGYIAGGTQGGGSNELNDPNEVDSYELGMKSSLAGGTVIFNLAAYYNDYSGLTSTSFVAQGETIVSRQVFGGSMTAKGLEMELGWQPTEEFSLTGVMAYNDSELDEFGQVISNRVFRAGGDAEIGTKPPGDPANSQAYYLDGHTPAFSPKWTLGIDASYRIDMGSSGALVPGVFFYYSDDYKTTNIPYFFTHQDSYTTWDLRMTWYEDEGPWSLQAYLNNATDELVKIGGDQFSEGRAVVDFNKPRTWGITARYNF